MSHLSHQRVLANERQSRTGHDLAITLICWLNSAADRLSHATRANL